MERKYHILGPRDMYDLYFIYTEKMHDNTFIFSYECAHVPTSVILFDKAYEKIKHAPACFFHEEKAVHGN